MSTHEPTFENVYQLPVVRAPEAVAHPSAPAERGSRMVLGVKILGLSVASEVINQITVSDGRISVAAVIGGILGVGTLLRGAAQELHVSSIE